MGLVRSGVAGAAILVLSVVLSCRGDPSTSTRALDGWALVKSTAFGVGYQAAAAGSTFFEVEAQIANVSGAARFLNMGTVRLRDRDGFRYACSTPWIDEVGGTYVFLLPGEVLWYTLWFEAPVGTQPESLVIDMQPWDDIASQRIMILPDRPPAYWSQQMECLDTAGSVTLLGLDWSIDLVRPVGDSDLEVILLIRNEAKSTASLVGKALYLIATDCYGRVSGPQQHISQEVPLDLVAGEVGRLRCHFVLKGLQRPVFLVLATGSFLRELEGAAWLLPTDN